MKSCKVFVCIAILAALTAGAVQPELTVRAALAPAALVSVTPNRGQQGQTITVTIIAQDTQFIPGLTEAKFGEGILVGGGGEGEFVRPGKFLFRITRTSGFVRLRGRISTHAPEKNRV